MEDSNHDDLVKESFDVSLEIDDRGFCINFDTKFTMKKEHLPYVLLHFIKAFCAEHKLPYDVEWMPTKATDRVVGWGKS